MCSFYLYGEEDTTDKQSRLPYKYIIPLDNFSEPRKNLHLVFALFLCKDDSYLVLL